MSQRQFSYLDDLAVRSILASENIAIPDARTEITESVTEGGGGAEASAGIEVPYVGNAEAGVDLSASKTGRQLFETSKRINDQYIFNLLYDELEGQINDLTEEEGINLSEGDLVKLEGVINTDAIYRILTLFNTYSEIMDIDNQEQIHQAYDLLYSDAVGVSLEIDESQFSFGMRFNPDKLWVDKTQAFLGSKKYVVFGRVSKTFGGDERWDYLHVAEMIDSVLDDDTMSELRNWASKMIDVVGAAEEDMEVPDVSSTHIEGFSDLERIGEATTNASFGLDIENKEIALEGPGFVIYPIAIYW
jgi:hypothetical protein